MALMPNPDLSLIGSAGVTNAMVVSQSNYTVVWLGHNAAVVYSSDKKYFAGRFERAILTCISQRYSSYKNVLSSTLMCLCFQNILHNMDHCVNA